MARLPEGTAAAFNRWMRDYIDNPEEYRREWQDVQEYLGTSDGVEPSYGQSCAALLERLLAAQEAESVADATS